MLLCISVITGECKSDEDCNDVDNSECYDSNADNKKDKCRCKSGYIYNSRLYKCDESGSYNHECKVLEDCKRPLDCKNKKCKCPSGYRYSSRLFNCTKGMKVSLLFLYIHIKGKRSVLELDKTICVCHTI